MSAVGQQRDPLAPPAGRRRRFGADDGARAFGPIDQAPAGATRRTGSMLERRADPHSGGSRVNHLSLNSARARGARRDQSDPLARSSRLDGAAAIQFGGERWSSGAGATEHVGRSDAGRALEVGGHRQQPRSKSALPGGPCASSLSHFSRQSRRQQTDPHPPPGRRCGCWPMSPWRDGSLYPLARRCRAPRRIMPELAATAPAIGATRSSRLDGAAAAGRTMVRSTSAAVAGFVSTIDIAGRTSRVLLLSLIPRGNPVRGRTLELGRSERTIMPAAAAPGARWI